MTAELEPRASMPIRNARHATDPQKVAMYTIGGDEKITEFKVSALLALYESLRQESLNTINNRVLLFIGGLTAIMAAGGAAFALDEGQNILIEIVFSYIIPIFSSVVLIVWLSEAVRCHRASYFIASDIEPQLNDIFGEKVISWEAAIWSGRLPRDELLGPSNLVLAIFGLIALASPPLGIIIKNESIEVNALWVITPYIGLSFVAAYTAGYLPQLLNTTTIISVWHGGYETSRFSKTIFLASLIVFLAVSYGIYQGAQYLWRLDQPAILTSKTTLPRPSQISERDDRDHQRIGAGKVSKETRGSAVVPASAKCN